MWFGDGSVIEAEHRGHHALQLGREHDGTSAAAVFSDRRIVVREGSSEGFLHILSGSGQHNGAFGGAAFDYGQTVFVGKSLDDGDIGRVRAVQHGKILAPMVVHGLGIVEGELLGGR